MASDPEQAPATVPIAIAMQRPAWRDTFGALRIRNYRFYVAAQLINNTAAWGQRIAVDWLVLELTDSVTLVGITVALQFLPTLLLGAWAGVVADRFPKRSVLVACQSALAALNLVLALLAITGHANLVLVYMLVLAIGTLQTFDNPARTVFVSELVGPRHLRNAISVNASIFHLGALIGPALSGVLIVAVGSGWAIGVNVIAGLIGIVLVITMRAGEMHPAPRAASSKGQIREAARYILSKPALFWTILMIAFVAMFGIPMPALLAGIANSVYETGPQGYGLYNSLVAVGALLGALASTRRGSLRLRTIMIGAMVYGLLVVTAGLVPFYPMFLAVLPAIGLARLLYMTASETMVQLSSNLAIRGRVMAFWVMVVVGGQAVGGPVVGWLGEHLGPKTALVICGSVPAIAAIVIALLLAHSGRLRVKVTARRGRWVAIVPRTATGD